MYFLIFIVNFCKYFFRIYLGKKMREIGRSLDRSLEVNDVFFKCLVFCWNLRLVFCKRDFWNRVY